MTLISVGIGQVFHVAEENLSVFTSDVPWDDYLAVALLLVFGVQTILGAEEETAEEEEEDAKVAVAGMQFDGQTALILSTFALVFAAEWGDKSFIATIALSAAAAPPGGRPRRDGGARRRHRHRRPRRGHPRGRNLGARRQVHGGGALHPVRHRHRPRHTAKLTNRCSYIGALKKSPTVL